MEKASEAVSPFRIELDAERKLKAAWLVEDEYETPVRLSAEDSNYGRLITWLLANCPDVQLFYSAPTSATFCTSEEDVIAFAKKNGLQFEVIHEGGGPQLVTSERSESAEAAQLRPALSPESEDANRQPTFFELYAVLPSTMPKQLTWDKQWIAERPTKLFANERLISQLNSQLADEGTEIRALSNWPIERTFVYIDISDFSKQSMQDQAIAISDLGRLLRSTSFKAYQVHVGFDSIDSLESSLCIGDGYILVYENPYEACFRACLLASLVEALIADSCIIDMHFRIGVHTGPVCRFWDEVPGSIGRWNYLGGGIIGAQRLLDAMGKDQDDVVYVSADARRAARVVPGNGDPVEKYLTNRGRRRDKQEVAHRVYEANHSAWMVSRVTSAASDWWNEFPNL